jgi:hypothetical protein
VNPADLDGGRQHRNPSFSRNPGLV